MHSPFSIAAWFGPEACGAGAKQQHQLRLSRNSTASWDFGFDRFYKPQQLEKDPGVHEYSVKITRNPKEEYG